MFKSMFYVFLAACSYGILSTFVKFAYEAGYSLGEVVGTQVFTGWLILLVIFSFIRTKPTAKQFVQLASIGLCTTLTGVFYYGALQYVTASFAILLLFQFTWMGVLLEAIVARQFPNKTKLVSVAIVAVGTVLATPFTAVQLSWTGIGLGLCSAFTYTLVIYLSGHVATNLPAMSRAFFIATGGLISAALIYRPEFLWNGVYIDGLWQYGALLGTFGIVLPTYLFAKGVPVIGGGIATILSAAELPVAVLLSAFVLHEHVALLQWVGVMIVLAGIVYSQRDALSPSMFRSTRRNV